MKILIYIIDFIFLKIFRFRRIKPKPGEFSLRDISKEDRSPFYYFFQYYKRDGQWVEEGDPICDVSFLFDDYLYKEKTFFAYRPGVLEWILEKGTLLEEGQALYNLHEKGEYEKENSVLNYEYIHYFESLEDEFSFVKWYVSDGDKVQKDDWIYTYEGTNGNSWASTAEKSGYIDLASIPIKKDDIICLNQLIYYIRDEDKERIQNKYINIPNLIQDDFTNDTIITWEEVSSYFEGFEGIVSKSDDNLVDLLFTFNHLYDGDNIIFHFNPQQVKPKRSDKVSFLFEDDSLVEFTLIEDPITIKNSRNERVLEYKSLITSKELNVFATERIKKWRIELISERNRRILGGESGSLDIYQSKRNLAIVIQKFAKEYIDLVNRSVDDYQPFETRQLLEIEKPKEDTCYVYLMHDTSNGYYKIGISNKPKYRERTLQSEKPTIELIISRSFPVRKIAESIERSLHEVFADKRLRGEWFELNNRDVEHVIETLE